MVDEENTIKVKLFFYCDDKKLRAKLFPDEWYTIVADEYGEDQVSQDFQPWLEVSLSTNYVLTFSKSSHKPKQWVFLLVGDF